MTAAERAEMINRRDEMILSVTSRYSGVGGDEYYMSCALDLARAGVALDEVPVGCVVVRDGAIIAADFNGRESLREATAHAEVSTIDKACRALGGWRLPGCTLYVTVEPCPMCAGAIWCARIPRVVIGTKDMRAGAYGGLFDMNSYPLNHKPDITLGVLEEECRAVMQNFFAARRVKRDEE